VTHTAVIQTSKGPMTLHVCKDGTTDNTDWTSVYDESFPPEQRQPLSELMDQIKQGTMELDETRDEHGNILCMTITEVFAKREPDFLLACYTAVKPEMRGIGIGSVHRRKLSELLQEEYSTFLGIFSEIESTKQPTDDPVLRETRLKRKRFFVKLGLIPLDIYYLFPSYDDTPALEGEFLWSPFGQSELSATELRSILLRIYTIGYGLREDDPLIDRVLSQIPENFVARAPVAQPG
jgi:hypothetical protein